MPPRSTTRYCADPEALSAMKRDGLGWGHDLDCGCFHETSATRTGPLARVLAAFKGRN